MREVLGVEPGSVTPFGLVNDRSGQVTTILDADVMAHERVNFHPLVNSMTTGISRDDLIRFLRATGHEPAILRLPEPSPEPSPGDAPAEDAPALSSTGSGNPEPDPDSASIGRCRRRQSHHARSQDDCQRAIPIPSEAETYSD